jgi:hypothetical protein
MRDWPSLNRWVFFRLDDSKNQVTARPSGRHGHGSGDAQLLEKDARLPSEIAMNSNYATPLAP